MKALIVDDNADNRYFLEVLLKNRGHETVSAQDGVAALEQLRREAVDLIISDILMPRMDGYRLCRECKRDEHLRDIPFLFVTSTYTDKKDEAFALSLGAEAFIRRPIEADDLMAIVEGVMAARREGRAPTVAPPKEEAGYLAEYAERLVSKLEKKVEQLEQEVAERERLEAELHEASAYSRRVSAYSRSLIEASLDPLVTISADGKITDVNEATVKATGVSRKTLIGSDFSDYFTGPDKARAGYREVFEKGFIRDYPLSLRHVSGKVLDVLYNASVYRNEKGEVAGVLAAARDVTERKRAEEALHKSAEEIEDLYNRAPIGYHSLDKDGTFVRINDTELAWLGYTRDDVIGKMNFTDVLTPDSQNAFRATFAESKARGWVRDLEYDLVRKDGTILPVLLSATAVKDAQGNFLMTRSTIYDVTARKKLEAELKRVSAYTRSLIEASLDPLVTISAEGKIMDVNQATERATGFPRKRLIGSDFSDYFTEPEKARQGYRQVLAEGFVKDYPLAIRNVFGRITEVLYNATVFRNEAGEVQGVFAAARDITERKRAEEALRASEERFRETLEYAPIGMAIASPEGRFMQVNRAMCAITGYDREELLKMSVEDITHPEDAAQDLAQMKRLANREISSYQLEKRYVRKDGRGVWVLITGSMLRGAPGRPPQVIKQAQDITPRKLAEQALQESEERYRSLVAALFEGVVLMDAGGAIQASNASAEQILGLTVDQMAGRTSHDPRWRPIHEDGSPFPGETHPAWITLQTGKPCHNIVMGIHKPEGALTWISINSQPLFRPGDAKPYAAVTSFADITERKLLEQELERQARADPLTGAANRRHFREQAEQELSRARRFGHPLSLLMLDIDHFKRVNDTFGHKVGDLVLQHLVQVCRSVLRDADIIARVGGEEFVALLPEASPERALQAAERLRRAVEATEVATESGSTVRFTISVGVATLRNTDGDMDITLARADQALYQAKETGRNRVCCEEAS